MATKNLPVNFDEQLAAMAADIKDRVSAPSGDKIQVTQDKRFVFPDGTEHEGPFNAVIVDFVSANFFYRSGYKQGEVTPPDCFALGVSEKTMVPSDNALNKQAKDCQSCPNNKFGSDGAGKACKNQRLLALLVVPEGGEITDETPLWTLALSPTALKSFDAYVTKIARVFNAPPVKVVSQIGFDPQLKYPSVRFGRPDPNNWLEASFARMTEARERLLTEPSYEAKEPAKPAGPAAAGARPVFRRGA